MTERRAAINRENARKSVVPPTRCAVREDLSPPGPSPLRGARGRGFQPLAPRSRERDGVRGSRRDADDVQRPWDTTRKSTGPESNESQAAVRGNALKYGLRAVVLGRTEAPEPAAGFSPIKA